MRSTRHGEDTETLPCLQFGDRGTEATAGVAPKTAALACWIPVVQLLWSDSPRDPSRCLGWPRSRSWLGVTVIPRPSHPGLKLMGRIVHAPTLARLSRQSPRDYTCSFALLTHQPVRVG